MLNIIIVEDSELARTEIKHLLKDVPFVKVVGEAKNGKEAIKLINNSSADVILLDIHLPDMDGFDVLNTVNVIPEVIFTTAYDEFALKSFEYNVVDYILKPIKKDRLLSALKKVEEKKSDNKPLSGSNNIFIKDGEKCYIAKLADIYLFETGGNYTQVYFKNESPLLHKSLNQIEERLDSSLFFRANRQQIININHITGVDTWFKGKLKLILTNNKEIEVSERQSVKLKQLLSI